MYVTSWILCALLGQIPPAAQLPEAPPFVGAGQASEPPAAEAAAGQPGERGALAEERPDRQPAAPQQAHRETAPSSPPPVTGPASPDRAG